jgi:tRNA U34 5-carboxymethylaminomethyl modifying GTPase MnmE/TrmE
MADPPVWIIRNKADLSVGGSARADLSANGSAKAELSAGGSASARSSRRPPPRSSPNSSPASSPAPAAATNESKFGSEFKFTVSALRGEGIQELLEKLEAGAREFFGQEQGLITRERHRASLISAQVALTRALGTAKQEELLAEELRLASRALGRLTGKVDVEDILDAIFRDFCIGK